MRPAGIQRCRSEAPLAHRPLDESFGEVRDRDGCEDDGKERCRGQGDLKLSSQGRNTRRSLSH